MNQSNYSVIRRIKIISAVKYKWRQFLFLEISYLTLFMFCNKERLFRAKCLYPVLGPNKFRLFEQILSLNPFLDDINKTL